MGAHRISIEAKSFLEDAWGVRTALPCGAEAGCAEGSWITAWAAPVAAAAQAASVQRRAVLRARSTGAP